MSSSLTVGEKIPIKLQLTDGRTDRFPVANVYNDANTLIAGPLSLTHVASGLYTTSTVVNMPNTPAVVVQFATFTDSGHTTPDPINGNASDEYTLDDGSSQVASLGGFQIVGVVDTSQIKGIVEES